MIKLDINDKEVSKETTTTVEDTVNKTIDTWSPEAKESFMKETRLTFSKNNIK
jgi:hypothetical protein